MGAVTVAVLVPSFERYINRILPKVKTITIGNAIPQDDYCVDLAKDKETYKIIFVGRLTKNHKRPQILIEAFAKLADKYPNWSVELWGQTFRKSFYAELQDMIKSNNLQNRVYLKGTSNNIPKVLKEAEGMCVGLPAVGYKSCVGVNELIIDGENGYLCDDGVEAFTQALDKLMNDKNLRIQMGKAAKESMKQFAPHNIWSKWENLLKRI